MSEQPLTVECPKCGQEIESVFHDRTWKATDTYFISDDEYEDEEEVIVSEQYTCPKCNQAIFNTGDEMLEYLKDKGIN